MMLSERNTEMRDIRYSQTFTVTATVLVCLCLANNKIHPTHTICQNEKVVFVFI